MKSPLQVHSYLSGQPSATECTVSAYKFGVQKQSCHTRCSLRHLELYGGFAKIRGGVLFWAYIQHLSGLGSILGPSYGQETGDLWARLKEFDLVRVVQAFEM